MRDEILVVGGDPCTHAARQRAIWVASLLLALLSMGVAVNTGLPFETGDVADLVFLAQMLAMLPPVAYAAAFTDLAAEPERLGISEVEASAPVRPMELTVARVAGALAVMTSLRPPCCCSVRPGRCCTATFGLRCRR